VDWNLGIVSILTTGIYSGLCCCVSEGLLKGTVD